MARPKVEPKRELSKEEIVQLRDMNGDPLPVPIDFPVYEILIDEQVAQYDMLAAREKDVEVSDIYNTQAARLRGIMDESVRFSGFCRPIMIGEHNQYVADGLTKRDIVEKHLVDRDGTCFFKKKVISSWFGLRKKEVQEHAKPGPFVERAFEAIMEASGYGLSDTGKKSARESTLTAAQLRIRELKKKVETATKGFERSASPTISASDSVSSPGRLLA